MKVGIMNDPCKAQNDSKRFMENVPGAHLSICGSGSACLLSFFPLETTHVVTSLDKGSHFYQILPILDLQLLWRDNDKLKEGNLKVIADIQVLSSSPSQDLKGAKFKCIQTGHPRVLGTCKRTAAAAQAA